MIKFIVVKVLLTFTLCSMALARAIASPCASESHARPLTCAADLQAAIDAGLPDRPFDISATVALPSRAIDTVAVIDGSGGVRFSCVSNLFSSTFRAGDRIHAIGTTIRTFENRSRALCSAIEITSHGDSPDILDVSAKDLWNEDILHRPVRIRGRVTHAFHDEIDPDWLYLILDCRGETAYAAVQTNGQDIPDPFDLIETQVSIEGICETLKYSNRRQVARQVRAAGSGAIRILAPGPKDPFSVPSLSEITKCRPEAVQKLGRHGCIGRVLAVWGESDLLLKATDGEIIRIDLLQHELPSADSAIEVVGIPSVCGMRVSLSKAIWRPSTSSVPTDKPPIVTTLQELFSDDLGRPRINVNRYGDPVVVSGHIRSTPKGNGEQQFLIESRNFTVEVDAGAGNQLPEELCTGCSVSVCGIFVVETDTWKSNHLLPQIKRAKIVMRSPADLEIKSFPPWWTTGRLIAAIAILCVILLAILVWNVSLQRISERRGRELAKESLARAETDMKVLERTRLAVELHDSVAQSLTAIGMELETAGRYKAGSRPELCSHLATAEKTLRSCRNDIRNCLWDLRNQALEEPDMVAAIRKMLLPHVKDVELSVRFACPREKLTDNTTHTILRIIRELVVNAIGHGHASAVKIAGSIEGNDLLFSVRDNGCGFDPEAAPGVLQGHFGLQGIRERLRPHKGSLRIVSAPGATTRVIVRIPIPPVKA